MKTFYKKRALLLMLIGMWIMVPYHSYSQSTCINSVTKYPSINYPIDTIQVNDSVYWINFTADSAAITVTVDSIDGYSYSDTKSISLYSGNCNNPILISSNSLSETKCRLSLYTNQLIVGNNYLIKITNSNILNVYFGLRIINNTSIAVNWDLDSDCPYEGDLVRNKRFQINYFSNFHDAIYGASSNYYSPFYHNGVCGWHSSLGSPRFWFNGLDILNNYPQDLNNIYGLLVGGRMTNTPNAPIKGEGIYQKVKTNSLVNYRFRMRYANTTDLWNCSINHMVIRFTNDSLGTGIPLDYLEEFTGYTSQTQLVYDVYYPLIDTTTIGSPQFGIWYHIDTIVQANANYKYLAITLEGNNSDSMTTVILDSVSLIPTEDFSIYNLVNDTTICLGDSAFLYGWAHYSSNNPPFPNNSFVYNWIPTNYMGNSNLNTTMVSPPTDMTYYFYAFNKINCWKMDSVTIHVTQPQASFVVQNDSICQDDVMYFIDNSTCTNGIVSRLWNFGDGSTSTLLNPYHTYSHSGTFYVTLTITDLNGNTSVYGRNVYVKPLPQIPQISGLNNNCDHDTGYYSIGNIQSGASYDWYIDGTLVQSNTSSISLLWSNYFPNTKHYIDISVIAMLDSCTNSNTYRVFACCNQPGTTAYNNDTIYTNTTITTPNIVVNGTLVIKADVSFDANNNNILMYMGPMAKIEVESGKDLTFDLTTVQAGCEYMWDGIYMDGANSKLEVKNYSSISDAINAINSDNGAKIKITNSSLGSNLYGIILKNSSSPLSPLELSKASFYGQYSLSYMPFQNHYSKLAVFAKDVNTVTIGDMSSANNTNTFDGFENAIIIENASSAFYNNSFTNSIEKSIKIKHSLLPMTPYNTTIGGENNSSGIRSNSFTDVYNAIFVQYQQNLSIVNNSFTGVGTWNTIELRDILSSTILVNNNTFSDVKMAMRSYNAYNSDISIEDNTITKATYGFGVMNTHPNEVTKLLIRNNDISIEDVQIFSRGIQVINIKGKPDIFAPMGTPNLKRAVIDSNRINISHTTIPNIYNYGVVGIDVQNSILAYIQDNILEKDQPDYDNSNAHKYIGIKVENSPNAVFCNNKMTKFGYGVECSGSSPNSRLVKTDIGISNYGVHLNNAHIGNQGYNFGNGITYDNTWYNGMYGTYKIIGNITTLTNWYYRSGNILYSPIPSLPTVGLFLTQLSSPNSLGCGIDTDPSYNKDPFEANDYFEAIVDNSIEYDTLQTPSNYYSRRYVYTIMKNNDELRNQLFALNSIYSQFYDEMQSSTVADFEEQNNDIAAANYENAQAILYSMSVSSDGFDYYEFQVDTIFLNTWAQDNLDLSSNQYSILREIAEGDNMLYGPAVYTARVMVGMENMGSTARIGHFSNQQTKNSESKIKVYPNPTSGLIEIESSVDLENATMEIYSLLGKKVKVIRLNNKHSSVDLSDLSQGIYIYRVVNNNSVIAVNKIIINK